VGEKAMRFSDLQARTGWRKEILQQAVDENLQKGSLVQTHEFYIAKTPFDRLKKKASAGIDAHHHREPLSKGIGKETLREKLFKYVPDAVFRAVISALENAETITIENDLVRFKQHRTDLSEQETMVRSKLSAIYQAANSEVPKLEEALAEAMNGNKFDRQHARKIFQLLIDSGEVIKISEEFYFSKAVIEGLLLKMHEFAAATTDRLIDVPKFKEIAGVSRKYAIPLLEYFDREKITVRAGDKRLIL
jgi:selenocysteine-specific elongation factor